MTIPSLLVLAAACGGDAAPSAEGVTGDPAALSYASDLDVSLDRMTRLPSGLYYEEVAVGDGEVVEQGDRAVVHYTGWLPDGQQFDSSREGGQPFEFAVGAGQVIEGWDEGVAGMRVGGRRKLVIPSELAYGSAGAGGVIPADATLVFDVELLEVRR